jgi:GT2 family glycosyltransferase
METIYILLPVHNRRDITQRFIQCLRLQTYRNYHLVLIDDGSTDGTEEMVRSQIQTLTVIKGRGDWWWAASLQQGYLWVKSQPSNVSDVVLIINDDTEFSPDFFEKALERVRSNPRILLFAQCYSRYTGEAVNVGFHIDWRRFRVQQAKQAEEVNCFSSTALFMRVDRFLETGGFRPKLLPHYGSDMEFTMRARGKGMELKTDPSVRVVWDERATGRHRFADGDFLSFLRKYFSKRSPLNPVVWTILIALSCPWPWKPINWLRVWAGAAWQVTQFLVQKKTGPQ